MVMVFNKTRGHASRKSRAALWANQKRQTYWTGQREELLRALVARGSTAVDAAVHFPEVNVRALRSKALRMGLQFAPALREGAHLWDARTTSQFTRMWLSGKKAREIAEALGIPRKMVHDRRRRLGLEPRKLKAHQGRASTKHVAEVRCLRCRRPFPSRDRKRHRICGTCRPLLNGVHEGWPNHDVWKNTESS